MIIETKEVYKCEHCRRLYQIKHFAESHEKACIKNPDNNRACFGCEFCLKKTVDLSRDHYNGGSYQERVGVLHCSKLNNYLVPPKAQHKGNSYFSEDLGDGDIANKLMPRECDHREELTNETYFLRQKESQ